MIGNELVFLDPHTNQPVVDLQTSDGIWDDSSYHCPIPSRMKISSLDPSIALVSDAHSVCVNCIVCIHWLETAIPLNQW